VSRQEHDKYNEILRQLRDLQKGISEKPPGAYSKDFIYFVVSLFFPQGYGEVDLFPRDSVSHPIVGWICWAIPLFPFCHILWNRLSSKPLFVRTIVVVTISAGFLTLASFAINSFIDRQRQTEQEEVSRNLSPHVLPPITENVMESVFSVTNGSSKTAIQSGMLFCGINQILGDKDGMPVKIGQLSSTAVPNASRLIPGDSRSEPCLMYWSTLVKKTQCVDMKLWMRYTIEPQPFVTREKWFRLVGYQSRGGGFNWYPEPVDSQMDYCDYFKRQTAPPI